MSDADAGVETIRTSVGISRLDHVAVLRLSGLGAWDLADRTFTRDLHIRDGQLSHGLLLHEDATLFGDCYLACDDEDLIMIVEGPDARSLRAALIAASEGVEDLEITDVSERRSVVGIDGPYAWELMSLLIGPEVVGLPYMTFFRADGLFCYRAGKTGEFGYRLLAPREETDALVDRLVELGEALDAAVVDLPALEQCALENWFLNIRREGALPVTPIELQLQWRISYAKTFIGSDALLAVRSRGIRQRLTAVVASEPIHVGDPVRRGGHAIGMVVNAGYAPLRSDWVGLALLDREYAWPGLEQLEIGSEAKTGRTVAPPFLRNRSLYVNPQIHAYATRAEDDFPPVCPA